MREKYAIFVITSAKTGFLVMISSWNAIVMMDSEHRGARASLRAI
jgi:hypothetical protein